MIAFTFSFYYLQDVKTNDYICIIIHNNKLLKNV